MHVWWRSRYKLTDLFFLVLMEFSPPFLYERPNPNQFRQTNMMRFRWFWPQTMCKLVNKMNETKMSRNNFYAGYSIIGLADEAFIKPNLVLFFFVRLRFVSLEIRSYKFAHDLNIWFACVKPQSSDRSFMWVCGWANRLKSNSAAVKGFDFSLSHTHTETHTTESLTRKLL